MTTLILAGGRSSRMGQDKALLPVRGIPLIRRVYDAAQVHCAPVAVMSPWGDRYRPVLPQACTFIQEVYPHPQNPLAVSGSPPPPGPLVGFCQGLTHICADPILSQALSQRQGWLLVLACDLPNLQADVLGTWQADVATLPSSTLAALPPYSDKGWHPLCGFYHRRCLPSLQAFIAAGGRSFQRWLATEEVRSLPVPDPALLLNCNTPEDLENAN